jgi:signal peptidase I
MMKIPENNRIMAEPSTLKTKNTEEETSQEEKDFPFNRIVKELALAVVFFLILQGSFARAFRIPSGSMLPTLQIGDRLLVNKLSYGIRLFAVTESLFVFDTPERGDIVVFRRRDEESTKNEDESDKHIIKRVIGTPGDEIQIVGQKVFVNGERISEDYGEIQWQQGGIKDFGPRKVPENKVFLMGDNRDDSRDSRYWEDPFLEIDRIEGRAFFIYWPRWKII